MLTVLETILNKTSLLLKSSDFAERHKKTEQSFTRKRTLGFSNIMAICLNFPKKSLQLELNLFFDLINSNNSITKQGFSKQRKLISPSAFQELFDLTVNIAMEKKQIKKYKKHRFFQLMVRNYNFQKLPKLLQDLPKIEVQIPPEREFQHFVTSFLVL